MTFLSNLRARAAKGPPRKILLPESDDSRIREAAEILGKEGIATPVFIDIDEERAKALERLLLEVRASKAGTKDELTPEKAAGLARDPLFYAMYLLREGEADGLVAGASRTTAEVLRAGLWLLGKAEGIQTVSSSMYMVIPSRGDRVQEEVLTFSDCAVVPEPTAEQLADIAIASADARSKIVGDEPRIAMLSYSTHGSGSGRSVEMVREALAIVRKRRPDLIVDGEMQVDAALVESIAERKAPQSVLKGSANVLVFPSLDAANIAYKLVAHLVPGAKALGPILQGFKKPMSDLSRGAAVEDIVNIATVVGSQVES